MSGNDVFFADLAACYDDPLRFVLWAFPWGTTPELSLVTLKEPWASRYPGCKYGPDKWACEVLDYIGEQVRANAFDGVHAVKPVQVAVASGHGLGKGHVCDTIVDTPDGERQWGDLKIGDRLWGPDGKPTTIVAIPYKGVRPCYRVTFDDGVSTIVSQEHLWTVYDYQGLPYTLETRQIAQLGCKKPVRFGAATFYYQMWKLPDAVDPYTMKRISRGIDSIEPIGERDTMCVTVDRDDGLYLANDFIVTHNSAITAWLVCWIMATRPGAKGAVTANTASQLETKTFAEISKWLKRSLVRDMFDIKASSVVQKDEPESWRVDALTCREENSEAFAGQHAASSTSFYIFDEASAVPDKIWEVAEGGLTDGEPMWFVFGNPTRNTGRFKECFGRFREQWKTFQIDSREAQITNKEQIAVWAKEYGEDSDFFRVRVRGQFPNASTTQFIPTKLAEDAMARPAPARHHIATAIVGVDVARFGDDDTVIVTRFGKDATTPFARYHGLSGNRVIALVKAKINELYREGFERVYVFLDEGGLGGAIVDVLRADGFREVRGVNFGQGADDPELYPFKREEMWARMKKWLEFGSIPNDQQLLDDLTGIEFEYNIKGQPKLESKADMKKRGLHSPDAADALALTWAYQVREVSDRTVGPERVRGGADTPRKFDPFDLKFCTRR